MSENGEGNGNAISQESKESGTDLQRLLCREELAPLFSLIKASKRSIVCGKFYPPTFELEHLLNLIQCCVFKIHIPLLVSFSSSEVEKLYHIDQAFFHFFPIIFKWRFV